MSAWEDEVLARTPVECRLPSNRERDTVRKLELYDRTGVGEYWIVDSDAQRLTVDGRSGARLAEVDSGRDEVHSPLAGSTVPIRAIW